MPLANTVWTVGRLIDKKITPVEQKLLLSLTSPEPITRRLLRDVPLNLFFAGFFGMAGLGLLAGFIALLLRGREVFLKPLAVAVVFTAPAYCWALAGAVSASLSVGTPLILLPIGIMVTVLALVPLMLHKGKPRFPSCLLFLIPVMALALGAGWFLDKALFTVSGRGWPLAAGISLFTGAVVLYFFWHFKMEPRPAK
jgi:hypothetical protein